IVMNLDDLLCIGVNSPILLSSTIGRNKRLIPGEVISTLIEGTEEFLEKMRTFGVQIFSTGGETADVGDLVRTIIVDSTVFTRMRRNEVIDNGNIREGDIIVGLASFGRAVYEDEYNSGIGSNGLTSARHDVFGKPVAEKYPETFDPEIPKNLSYTGTFNLTDNSGVEGKNMGKLVLSPTRTYAPVVHEIFKSLKPKIHGMIHCSGGGQTKILHFVDNIHVVKDNCFTPPPLFQIIKKLSGSTWQEMYRVFNMGHRMEFYTDEKTSRQLIEISKSFGIDAQIIGYCRPASKKKLTITTNYGTFEYDD
ncbi:MAG: phosphoribosylformylglycinamidine cyclo-ligase, partial [Sphingobacteriia bacterium]|nr:phosphoribosylformylglycinamidine cyclo-ligase [Sphingobacteriia bacterium]